MKNILLLLAFSLAAEHGFAQKADSLQVARTVDSLLTTAEQLWQTGKYDEVLPLAQQAADLSKQTWGKYNAQYASALHRLAVTYLSKADYKKSEVLYLEAIEIRKKVLGKDDPDYARSVSNLAIVYNYTGRYEEAEAAFLEALDIYERTTGKKKGRYASCLNNLGDLYTTTGQYEKAETAFLETSSLRAEVLGKDHPDYAISLISLTRLYLSMDNYRKAEAVNAEARGIYEKAYQGGNLKYGQYYAYCLDDAGTLNQNASNWRKAEDFYLQSIAIKEKVVGKQHPDYAVTLNRLANLYLTMENYEKAEPLYLEAIAILEKIVSKENTSYMTNTEGLTTVYRHTGRREKAEPLLLEVLATQDKKWGKENKVYSRNLLHLADLHWASGQLDKAYPYLLESSEIERRLLINASRYLSEQELAAYIHEFIGGVNGDFSFAQTQKSLSFTCFDNTLFYKGFLLNAVSQVNRLAMTDSATAKKYYLLKSYHRRLATEYAKPISERGNVTELETAANSLEKDLTRSVASFGEALRQVSWQEVQQKLKPGEAAVEFVHYQFSHPEETDSMMYAALVLRPGDAQPQFIPLFEEKELTPLLHGATGGSNFMKINALYAEKTVGVKAKSLYKLIWQPLESQLQGITTIYCSPSGLLHRLNLAAIPDKNGKVFGDERQLVLLGSTRQLVIPNSGTQNVANNAYLVGGIRYDSDSTTIAYANRGSSSRSIELRDAPIFQPDSSSTTRGGVLDYLPATANEVREIGQILNAANISAKVDTGFYATEETFRNLGVGKSSPRMIHLATHGYFFPDPKDKGQKKNGSFGQEPVFKMSEHPMIRSGLILAGAKQAWLTGKHPQNQADGILTAYEISQMNLSNTELVVLSACETGLGDIEGNEGVYGLQRAFKIAGAKYLIMSLWKVDDRSTQEFMTSFYKHWLTEKQTIPQAFQVTQREMRIKHPSAYDWAGFILIE